MRLSRRSGWAGSGCHAWLRDVSPNADSNATSRCRLVRPSKGDGGPTSVLKQPSDCFRACWLGCRSCPGCRWSTYTSSRLTTPESIAPAATASASPLRCGVVFLLCTAILLLHLHTTAIHASLARPACAAYLNPADLIHTPLSSAKLLEPHGPY